MASDIHRAPTATEALDDDPATADLHPLEEYIAWLEQVARSLAAARAVPHLRTCERLMAELRRMVREDQRDLGPMQPEIRHILGGMRAILRAVGAGELPLTNDLRADLIELVRDATALVFGSDLG